MLDSLAESVASVWQKLAIKLGYGKDEVIIMILRALIYFVFTLMKNSCCKCNFQIEFIIAENADETSMARKLLQAYVDSDEDASPEMLAYTLEGLGLTDAVSIINSMAQ